MPDNAAPDRPSLASIAGALGVSTATVSNAFSRPGRVAARTRARIVAEAARVGYVGPDPAGRQLRRGRTDTVGLVLTDEMSFAFDDLAAVGFLAGVAEACQSAGRNLMLLSGGPPDQPGGLTSVHTAPMDAVIVYSVADDDPHLEVALRRGLPVTVVDQPQAGPAWDWVGLDDRLAAAEVGRHLAAAGHRRMGVLTSRLTSQRRSGPVEPGGAISYHVREMRLRGFLEGVGAYGIMPEQVPVEERYESSSAAGADALTAMLARHPETTALFCLSDVLALGALSKAAELSIAVPQRLSIVGFDDLGPAAAAGLTTVHQPLRTKGRIAAEAVIRRLEQHQLDAAGSPKIHRVLPTSLEIRTTTAPPAAARAERTVAQRRKDTT